MATVWPDAKDPDDNAEYSIDWAPRLDEGDAISSSEWIVPSGLTMGVASLDGNIATVWLSGGTHGERYVLVNRVHTQQGRTFDEGAVLYVVSAGSDRLIGAADSIFAGLDLSDPCAIWPRMQAAYDRMLMGESVVRVRFQGHETEFGRGNMTELKDRIADLRAACEAKTTPRRIRRHAIRGGFRCL